MAYAQRISGKRAIRNRRSFTLAAHAAAVYGRRLGVVPQVVRSAQNLGNPTGRQPLPNTMIYAPRGMRAGLGRRGEPSLRHQSREELGIGTRKFPPPGCYPRCRPHSPRLLRSTLARQGSSGFVRESARRCESRCSQQGVSEEASQSVNRSVHGFPPYRAVDVFSRSRTVERSPVRSRMTTTHDPARSPTPCYPSWVLQNTPGLRP